MNKVIIYKDIFAELVHKHGAFKTISIINNIRKFSPSLKNACFDYFITSSSDGVNITINSVSLTELIEEEHFEPILAFLMLDWLEKYPEDAFDYMERCRFRTPIKELNEDEKMMIRDRIAEIRETNQVTSQIAEKEDTSDIVVEDSSC